MPRGKYSKPTRGGGKKFSRDLKPLDAHGDEVPGMWDAPRGELQEESSEAESSEEESGSEDDGPTASSSSKPKQPVVTAEMTREERRAAQKAIKEAKRAQAAKATAGLSGDPSDDEESDNEVAETAKPKQPKAPVKGFDTMNLNSQGATSSEPVLTRREREAIEAAAAKERYRKLHEAGKTDEAKADLARLAMIRKEREEKAAQRKAELEEKKRVADVKAASSGKKLR